ncbi:MAG: glucuronate isomerase, partial [Bacteroidales bacterium]|nr:glucuronate isomerase [Bacteroidales bacterium]
MTFINDNFMLQTETARELYRAYAEKMPIIDYHCHLSPQQIAENIQFRDITQLWVIDGHAGDHYKWRAMRANGVSEDYLT